MLLPRETGDLGYPDLSVRTMRHTRKSGVLGAKNGIFPAFSGDFRRPNLTMWEILGLKIFHWR